MSSLLKNLIISLTVVVLLGLVYMFTLGKDPEEVTIKGEMSGAFQIRVENEKILANTREIGKYNMDVSILRDVRFTSLKNYHVKIEDVGTGRSNPFAPLE